MSAETLDVIVNVISDVCGIERAELAPDKNAIDDLAIDSVDMLDIIYELNRHFDIKIPAESWGERISSGSASTADYFVLAKFAQLVDDLALEKRKSSS